MDINDVIKLGEKDMKEFEHIRLEYNISRTAFRESAFMMENARIGLMKQAEEMFPELKDFRFTINWHKNTIIVDSDKD